MVADGEVAGGREVLDAAGVTVNEGRSRVLAGDGGEGLSGDGTARSWWEPTVIVEAEGATGRGLHRLYVVRDTWAVSTYWRSCMGGGFAVLTGGAWGLRGSGG